MLDRTAGTAIRVITIVQDALSWGAQKLLADDRKSTLEGAMPQHFQVRRSSAFDATLSTAIKDDNHLRSHSFATSFTMPVL